jgi:hypothetical protein
MNAEHASSQQISSQQIIFIREQPLEIATHIAMLKLVLLPVSSLRLAATTTITT